MGNTYLYLLLMELICSIPTKTDNRNSESEGGDTFIDLIERFPLYIHTDFAMKWMLLKRFSILKRNPDGLRAKNPEIYSLANALCGTPPTFRPRVKSTKPTPVGMTSDLSLFLMVGQNCNFKNYSKKADEEANRLLTELGMKMKNNEMMVKSWEEIKRKGSKKIRELAKLKLSGQKNIEPDNHFRLRWLSLLFEDIGPSTMGYLTGRYILYSEVISLPSSKEFVSVMNDVRYRTSANAT